MAFRKESELPLGLTPNDLPAWMRKSRREIDWALLVVLVMCIVVIWPLITRPGLPRNEGIQTELARTIEIAESIVIQKPVHQMIPAHGNRVWVC